MRAAIGVSPSDDSLRLRLGLRAEAEGKFAEAERELLHAAQLSRKYAPRWTLANFYYRHGNAEQFWRWTREALAISYGDRRPLFDLCWSLNENPGEILESAIPARRAVQLDFAAYIFDKGDVSSEALLVDLARNAEKSESGYFLHHVNRLLEGWRFPTGLTIWNSLCSRGLIPYAALKPGEARVLTNGRFSEPSLGQGFDWRIPEVPGVFTSPIRAQGAKVQGWNVWLTGAQPEQCELLSQFVPIEPGNTLRVNLRYWLRPPPSGLRSGRTGIFWAIVDKNRKQIAGAELIASGDVREDSFASLLGGSEMGARLILHYQRPAGSPRMETEIRLQAVSIEPQD